MTRELPLNKGQVALIDEGDFAALSAFTWRVHPCSRGYSPYIVTSMWIDGVRKNVPLHRYLMAAKPGEFVDHKNRDTFDNRRENLRFCSHRDNTRNRSYSKSNGLPKGVYKRERSNYFAAIAVDARQISLGSYMTATEAAVAYDIAADHLFGDFAALNFSKNRDWILPVPKPTRGVHPYMVASPDDAGLARLARARLKP
jgi:hypothetical protein